MVKNISLKDMKFKGKEMSESIKIRYANENDALLLTTLGRKTFYDTFAAFNTPEDMVSYLSESFSDEKQAAEIADPNITFLIAEIQDDAVGYVKLKTNSRDDGVTGHLPIELERIYSVKEQIGKGVGAELIKASIKEARDRGFDCLWLGVWDKNERAIRFYEKWGFTKVGSHVFMLGKDVQNDLIMELGLT